MQDTTLVKNKEDTISFLKEMAILLELEGANPFKIRAFSNAARTLENLSDSFDTLVLDQKLTTLPGIGKGIASDVETFTQTGTVQAYQDLKDSFPESLFELFEVPFLGPKKIKVLYNELEIHSLSDLEYACQENRLLKLKGFGEKTQNKIKEGIQFIKQSSGQFLLSEAQEMVKDFYESLKKLKEVQRIELAGSLRRKKEVVHDADIVCASDMPKKLMQKIKAMKPVSNIIASGETKTSVILESGLQVDIRVVDRDQFASAWVHFTGSKEHNTLLRTRAKSMGLKLNEYGVFKKDKALRIQSEKDYYKALKLEWIDPVLREGINEIDQAQNQTLPVLVESKDIKGFFHFHTTYSDGKNTLEEMIQKAMKLGYQYIGVSDHSQSAFYAHGLKEKDIDRQHQEIEKLQKKYPDIEIFKGIESDILKDGSLDYPDKILKRFDFVIASVHSGFSLSKQDMTQRCIRALENPYTTMLGHPTGRLLLGRKGFEIDMAQIIKVASKLGKVIELNASPYRLDVDWRLLPLIKKYKGLISINPDAHSLEGIDAVSYGVYMAQKGGLEKKHIVNTKDNKAMQTFLAKRAK